jgi:hypothetical protein
VKEEEEIEMEEEEEEDSDRCVSVRGFIPHDRNTRNLLQMHSRVKRFSFSPPSLLL